MMRYVGHPALRAILRNPLVRRAAAGFALAVLPLAVCATDTNQLEGTWHPQGVNAVNIAAQVADPRDLVQGRSDTSPHYKSGAAAVSDLWSGKAAKQAAAAAASSAAAAQAATP